MVESSFIKIIDKYKKPITAKIVENLEKENSYLFKKHLKKEYSVSGKWDSLSGHNTNASADFVALDSPLPIKSRPSLYKASGDIQKTGMMLGLGERELNELDIMLAQGVDQKVIIQKLFADNKACIKGVYEHLEHIFLSALSSGVAVIPSLNDPSQGIRLDFGYRKENTFGVSSTNLFKVWELENAIRKAKNDGNTITDVFMSPETFNMFRDYRSRYEGGSDSTRLDKELNNPNYLPDLATLNQWLKARPEYGCEIHIVDRRIVKERNGKREVINPWKEGMVVLTTSPNVGKLVYSSLAEMNHPVAGVSYEKVDDYILTSKFRENNPLGEFTSSQAMVLPVICDVDKIYVINTKERQI